MHKIINSVAVIEVNKAIGAVEIHMRGYGCVHQYADILKMATNIAHLHRVKNYLLVKTHFEDIDYHQFYQVAASWLSLLDQRLSHQCIKKAKVAIVVQRDVFLPLSSIIHKAQNALPKDYEHLRFDLFYAYHKALGFLEPSRLQEIAQS